MANGLILYSGDEEIELPTRWAICGCCQGNGTSSAYLGAITMSDREPGGSWDDPEDFEDYMAGHYDRPCDRCGGSGKVRIADREQMTDAQCKAWDAQCEDERDFERMAEAERRMGA